MGEQSTIDHLRDLVRERDEDMEVLRKEAETLTGVLTRTGEWICEHARHAEDCEEEPCTCGLEELTKDLC